MDDKNAENKTKLDGDDMSVAEYNEKLAADPNNVSNDKLRPAESDTPKSWSMGNIHDADFMTQGKRRYFFFRFSRSITKKSCSRACASSSSRPASMTGWWLNGRANRSVRLPQQPALGSRAP